VERRGGMGVMPVTVVCGCLCSLAGNREGASVVLEQRRGGQFPACPQQPLLGAQEKGKGRK